MRNFRQPPITFEMASKMFRIDDEANGVIWASDPYKKGGSVGKRPGYRMKSGYRLVRVFRKSIYEHHLVWLLTTGAWPSQSIDHINRVRDDNRANNLRLANQSQQLGNSTRVRNVNPGLPRGVIKSKSRFVARIGTKGEDGRHWTRYIGSYESVEEAASAYNNEAKKRWGDYFSSI